MSFEQPGTGRLEQHESIEDLENFIKAAAERHRAKGVPVSDDGRIDMLAYKNVYPDHVERDFESTREGKANAEAIHKERLVLDGEKLEMLAYAIFTKNLGERFIVARSAPHDDRINKVDTLLLDRETGNLVCAFDEVGDTTGEAYEKKLKDVRDHNLHGGASLKYGIGMDEDGKIKLTNVRNVPIFYVALPKDRINKGIAEFLPDTKNQSEFEKRLFTYFIATITAQIAGLKLYKDLNPELKERLNAFKKMVGELESKQEKK